MGDQPRLQGPHHGPRRVLDQMREAVVEADFAPVAQYDLGVGIVRLCFGLAHALTIECDSGWECGWIDDSMPGNGLFYLFDAA